MESGQLNEGIEAGGMEGGVGDPHLEGVEGGFAHQHPRDALEPLSATKVRLLRTFKERREVGVSEGRERV